MKKLLALTLLLLNVTHAFADPDDTKKLVKQYDVEIIIFEDAHARYLNSQSWGDDSNAIITDKNTRHLPSHTNDNNNEVVYSDIKPAILSKQYKRINNSSEYKILFYGSWRQTGLSAEKAFEIDIDKLQNNYKKKSEHSIAGHLKLVLARYLHIYGELNYQRPSDDETADQLSTAEQSSTTQEAGSTQKINNYPINFHRRMRSKELHYIDHPLVGILIQINPVKTDTE